jgi:alpha-amylase
MASVVFYFQVHQPWRLRRYTVFDNDHFYFDHAKNGEICRKVADKCYRPATSLILDLIRRHEGRFRVSFSITGVALDQFQEFTPDVIDLFRRLADTGACEFLAETYYHSLSFLYSREEFAQQVDLHTRRIESLFGQTPRVFRNTELIYNNDVAHVVANMKDDRGNPRFKGILCEGADHLLGYRSPNYLYRPPHTGNGPTGRPFCCLLKNYRLSDDIAFRFSNRAWAEWPLKAERFAHWVNQINGDGYVCNLFMDYETFGEHQWAETGIFQFLDALPGWVYDVNPGHNDFLTVSEAIERYDPVGVYDVPHMISWADTERDLSAWLGNSMQSNALQETYKLERPVKARLAAAERSGDEREIAEARYLLEDWRRLTTSDHFYYMCTKYWADGDVHKYFSPYDSPYDGYINFMNVLDNVRARAAHAAAARA